MIGYAVWHVIFHTNQEGVGFKYFLCILHLISGRGDAVEAFRVGNPVLRGLGGDS